MLEPSERRPRQSLLRWQIVTAGIGLVVVAGFLLQSAGSYRTVLVAAGGGTYVEAMVGGPRYINPLLSQYNQVDASIAALVFNGLTTTDACGNVVPDLAERWGVSGDGLRYTFDLRQDAYWHDGVPVVAEDVAYTVSVIQSPDYQGPPSIAPLWREVKVTVLDEHTIAFDLPEPYGAFLSYTSIGILPSHVLSGTPVAELTELEFNRLPIGSGPYEVVESDSGHVLLRPAATYYGEHPYVDGVEFRFFRDLGEALRAHERSEVQGIAGVTAEYIPEVAASGGLNVYSGPLARLSIIMLNLKSASSPYLEERSVRQALMLGLDRNALVANVLEGRGLVAHAPFSVCSW
ncbi:MAG: ABC transporter substrate-binding protein, partial [Dermatophilaceae bacterium]